MRPSDLAPVLLLCCGLACGQQATQTSVFTSPGSQVNFLPSCLIMSASVQAPGQMPSPFVPLMSLFSPSTTLAYVCDGLVSGVSPGALSLVGALEGTPNAPFVLAIAVMPGAQICGGFAGAPCMTGPSLYSSIPTPSGIYHLGPNPVIVFDGLTPGPFPGVIPPTGSFPLNAVLPVDTATNGGVEQSFAIQAAVVNAAAPSGLTLSACLNVDQWVVYP